MGRKKQAVRIPVKVYEEVILWRSEGAKPDVVEFLRASAETRYALHKTETEVVDGRLYVISWV